jgi:aspartate 1-decarboxylase
MTVADGRRMFRIPVGTWSGIAVLRPVFSQPYESIRRSLMRVTMLRAKIHRATVTRADLHYVGSLTVDRGLLEASGILVGERVSVVDIDNGERFETYVIEGEPGSGVIGVNGAAARLVSVGDRVIIMAYGSVKLSKAQELRPRVIMVDEQNRVQHMGDDPAFPTTYPA